MNINRYLRILFAAVLPLTAGCILLVPVIISENGYVAGFIFLPMFGLALLIGLGLIVTGLIMTGVKGRAGLWWLPPGPFLFAGFVGLAVIAKQFEVGAYREEPMVPLFPEVSNIVLFEKETTDQQIEHFLQNTLATMRADGRGYESLPGLRATMRLPAYEGYEAVAFDFFDTATEEQRQSIYSRVRSSSRVFKLMEHVATKEYMQRHDEPSANNNIPTKEFE